MTPLFSTPYFNQITALLARIETTQLPQLEAAAQALAGTLERGGVIHTFGCGHSGSVALEPFHRSGCFIPVNAILDGGLMFQLGAHTGTALERMEGYSPIICARHEFKPEDTLIVVSNSGRNAAGIDAVLYAQQFGVQTIAITAASAHTQSAPRHSSGKLLKDVADMVLDNCCPKEEASLNLEGLELAPISTIGGTAVLHAAMYRAAEILLKKGIKPPVYKSSNAATNDESNESLSAKYAARVKHID